MAGVVGIAALVVAGALVVPATTLAAPARVKVFEAAARAKPDAAALVVKTFPEDTELSVSEEVTDGWRRVRLPDESVGYVRDDEVELDDAQPAPARATPRRVAAPEPERPASILYIKNLDHLSEVVRRDDVVFQQVDALKTRRNLAWGSLLVGGAVGLALEVGALTVFAHDDCTVAASGSSIGGPFDSSFCVKKLNEPMLLAGVGTMMVGGLVGLLLLPKHGDLLDVINTWNQRHVYSPITVDRGVAAHGD